MEYVMNWKIGVTLRERGIWNYMVSNLFIPILQKKHSIASYEAEEVGQYLRSSGTRL